MNTTIQSQKRIEDDADNDSPRIRYLRDRIADLKRRASESPGFTNELRTRLECYEKSLNELLATPKQSATQNRLKSESTFDAESFAAGQQPDKGRTDAGQTPDTDRTSSGQTADRIAELSSLEKEILEDLNQASQSPLDKLPAEKQAQLYDLVTHQPISAVLNAISIPAPQGWGLRTSRQSLYRFRDRHRELKRREHRRQMKTAAQAVLEDLEGADEQFVNASERLLKLRLLETANDPASKTRDLRDLFTTLIRLRAPLK